MVQDFEALILALILLNCISMAAFQPQQPVDIGRNRILGIVETVVNVAFTIEILLKLAASRTVAAYFRSQWNVFDFLLVAAGYTTFLPFGESTSSFKVWHCTRARIRAEHHRLTHQQQSARISHRVDKIPFASQ